MPISSLPAPHGIGTLGKSAYAFVDQLKRAGAEFWQVLPLLPTGFGDSPYQSCSGDALNFYFIDFDLLAQEGLLEKAEYEQLVWCDDEKRVDYGRQFWQKHQILRKAFARLNKTLPEWQSFLAEGKYADFALFMALKVAFDYKPWTAWGEYKEYSEQKAQAFIRQNRDEYEFWQFTQFIFLKQWRALKAYANENGVQIVGDMPIYLSSDSVEMWKHKSELFMLGEDGELAVVAGVPPDAFSKDGQLWGNPVYDYEKMKKDGYAWWKARIDYALDLFDYVRIDHFRGFDRFFAVPSGEQTAKNGEWLDGPKAELFKGREHLGIIAEDLGLIDEGVVKLMRDTGFPGMKVLSFGFNGDEWSEHKPSNYPENCVAYTGTHDNAPLCGMIADLGGTERAVLESDLKRECEKLGVYYHALTDKDICQTCIKTLLASKAWLVVVPYHDLLCQGNEARLNEPSTMGKNWTYRFTEEELDSRKWDWLKTQRKKFLR